MIPRALFCAAVATSLVAVAPPRAAAVGPDETDPRAIMTAVEERARGDKLVARLQMTIIDPSGRKRERVVRSRGMDFEGGTRQLLVFESPADVRNTGLLSVDYDDGGKTDDQWLYLPSLKKSMRIASGDKSGSFMGSDFTYADMTRADPSDYDYTLTDAKADVGGEACWLIEATPRNDRARKETGYAKTQVWISKTKLVPLQAKSWVTEGRKLKYLKFEEYKQLDGTWIAHRLSARTTRNGRPLSTTVLVFSDLKLNQPDVKADDFTQRRLEQGL